MRSSFMEHGASSLPVAESRVRDGHSPRTNQKAKTRRGEQCLFRGRTAARRPVHIEPTGMAWPMECAGVLGLFFLLCTPVLEW